MTTDELRDSVAELLGWELNPVKQWQKREPWGWTISDKHPIDGTLDQLARLWGEHAADRWLLEMEWNRTPEFACKASRYSINNSDSLYEPVYVMVASEYEARLRLLYAVLVAEGRK